MIPWLTAGDPFPAVESALHDPNGLLAAGGDLSPDRLIDAYRRGIFPWFGDDDPLLWWSPDPRMVLVPGELHVSRSLRRTLKSHQYTITLDTAFRDVMAGCAEPRDEHLPSLSGSGPAGGTWITPAIIDAYVRLAALGHAHSVEAWSEGELRGGLYGVALGRMFYGESMFSRRTDASKIALVMLVRQLDRWGFELIDCQTSTEHLARFGARELPRAEFVRRVQRLVTQPPVPSPWVLDQDVMKML